MHSLMANPVLESAEWVSQHSKDVSISPAGVKSAAAKLLEAWKSGLFQLELWRQHELNPSDANENAMEWYERCSNNSHPARIFVVDTLNFSFWADSESELATIEYGGKEYTGYWSMCAAIDRAQTV